MVLWHRGKFIWLAVPDQFFLIKKLKGSIETTRNVWIFGPSLMTMFCLWVRPWWKNCVNHFAFHATPFSRWKAFAGQWHPCILVKKTGFIITFCCDAHHLPKILVAWCVCHLEFTPSTSLGVLIFLLKIGIGNVSWGWLMDFCSFFLFDLGVKSKFQCLQNNFNGKFSGGSTFNIYFKHSRVY